MKKERFGKTYKKISNINKIFIGTVCFSLVTSQLYIATADEQTDEDELDGDSPIVDQTSSPLTEPEKAVIDEEITVAEGATTAVSETITDASSLIDADGEESDEAEQDAEPDEAIVEEAHEVVQADANGVMPLTEHYLKLVTADGDSAIKLPMIGSKVSDFKTRQPIEVITLYDADYNVGHPDGGGSVTWTSLPSGEVFQSGDVLKGEMVFTLPTGWSKQGAGQTDFSICDTNWTSISIDSNQESPITTISFVYTFPSVETVTLTIKNLIKPEAGNANSSAPTYKVSIGDAFYDRPPTLSKWTAQNGDVPDRFVGGQTYSISLSLITKELYVLDQSIAFDGDNPGYIVDITTTPDEYGGYKYDITISYTTEVKQQYYKSQPRITVNTLPVGGMANAKPDVTFDPAMGHDAVQSTDVGVGWTGSFDGGNYFVAGRTYQFKPKYILNPGWSFENPGMGSWTNGITISGGTTPNPLPSGYVYDQYIASYTIPVSTTSSGYIRITQPITDGMLKTAPADPTVTTIETDALQEPEFEPWEGSFDKDGKFVEGNTYTRKVTLTTKGNFKFADQFKLNVTSDSAAGYTASKLSAAQELNDTGNWKLEYELSYTVPQVEKFVQTAKLETIKQPVAGESPQAITATLTPTTAQNNKDCTNAFSSKNISAQWTGVTGTDSDWDMKDGKRYFKAGSTYSFTFDINTAAYWKLDPSFSLATSSARSAMSALGLPTSANASEMDSIDALSAGLNALSTGGFGAYSTQALNTLYAMAGADGSFSMDSVQLKATNDDKTAVYTCKVSYSIPVINIDSAEMDVSSLTILEGSSKSTANPTITPSPAGSIKTPEFGTWECDSDSGSVFVGGKTYKKKVTLTTTGNYKFASNFKLNLKGNTDSRLTLNGPLKAQELNGTGNWKIEYELSYQVPMGISYVQTAKLETVQKPVAGDEVEPISAVLTPLSALAGKDCTDSFLTSNVSVQWAGATGTNADWDFIDGNKCFKDGTTYSFTFNIDTAEGWRLANGFAISTLAVGSGFTYEVKGVTVPDDTQPATYACTVSFTMPPAQTSTPEPATPPAPAQYNAPTFISEIGFVDLVVPVVAVDMSVVESEITCDGDTHALESSNIKSKWEGNFDRLGRFKSGQTYTMRVEITTKPHYRLSNNVKFKIRSNNEIGVDEKHLTPLSISPEAGLGEYRFGSLFTQEFTNQLFAYKDEPTISVKRIGQPKIDKDDRATYTYEITCVMPASFKPVVNNSATSAGNGSNAGNAGNAGNGNNAGNAGNAGAPSVGNPGSSGNSDAPGANPANPNWPAMPNDPVFAEDPATADQPVVSETPGASDEPVVIDPTDTGASLTPVDKMVDAVEIIASEEDTTLVGALSESGDGNLLAYAFGSMTAAATGMVLVLEASNRRRKRD